MESHGGVNVTNQIRGEHEASIHSNDDVQSPSFAGSRKFAS
jgi:hypothetical protein